MNSRKWLEMAICLWSGHSSEVPSSTFGDFNVCFDFPLIHVAIALNIHKIEH